MVDDDHVFRSQVRRLHVLSISLRSIFHYVPCIIVVPSHLMSALSQCLVVLNPINQSSHVASLKLHNYLKQRCSPPFASLRSFAESSSRKPPRF
jgi:hypothetical protein